MFYVYILRTSANTLYIGQTKDLKSRLNKHREGKGAKYLRMSDSFELVYHEKYKTRGEAMRREVQLKKLTRAKKEELIARAMV